MPAIEKGKTSKKRVCINVMMLEKFQNDVPKREARKPLKHNGKEKRIFASRGDSHQHIKEKINWAFHTDSYLYLECIKGETS